MATIKDTLHAARQRIEPVSDSAGLDAQVLLADALGVERAYLLAHPEQMLTPEQESRCDALVARAAAGEPLAYILGRRAFYDREFIVSPAVLIPRPETELLLEEALSFVRQFPRAVVVDVGTGSGALAVTLAAHCPQAQVYAADISPDALSTARLNAAKHGVQVEFMAGDLLQPLIERRVRVDVVMANLPYIPAGELPALMVSRYEPRLALDGGADGLALIRRLVGQMPGVCNSGALALLEIGVGQGAAALALVREALPLETLRLLKDCAGIDRLLCAQLSREGGR